MENYFVCFEDLGMAFLTVIFAQTRLNAFSLNTPLTVRYKFKSTNTSERIETVQQAKKQLT